MHSVPFSSRFSNCLGQIQVWMAPSPGISLGLSWLSCNFMRAISKLRFCCPKLSLTYLSLVWTYMIYDIWLFPNSLAIFKLQRANLSPYDCWIPNWRSGFIQTLIETLIEALKYQSGQSIIGQDNLCNWEWYIYSRHSLHDILRWILQRSYCQWMVAKSESPVDGHHPIIIPVYRMPPQL